ncbi:MAG: hypothetical protein VCD33_17500 [Alphaproteobacteria bacterium]
MPTPQKHFVFTMTPGRSGTGYLAALLEGNGGPADQVAVHHEFLGFDDFGRETPEMSHFTGFNCHGNTPAVRRFWEQKLGRIAATPGSHYVETSHLLMKAGLVENIDLLTDAGTVHFVVLRRDPAATVRSYRRRGDFVNRINMRLWCLDPDYPRNIVKADAAMASDKDGICLWYICEVMTRAAHYRQILAGNDRVVFHDAALETLADAETVNALLDGLHLPRATANLAIPGRINESPPHFRLLPDEAARIDAVIKKYPFDPDALARDYIEKGGSLG